MHEQVGPLAAAVVDTAVIPEAEARLRQPKVGGVGGRGVVRGRRGGVGSRGGCGGGREERAGGAGCRGGGGGGRPELAVLALDRRLFLLVLLAFAHRQVVEEQLRRNTRCLSGEETWGEGGETKTCERIQELWKQ